LKKELEFRPYFPGGKGKVEIRNFRVGDDIFHFEVKRHEDKLVFHIDSKTPAPYRLFLSPSLGFGARVKSVKVNGEEKVYKIEERRGEIFCSFFVELGEQTDVEIEYKDHILILIPPHYPQIGDRTTGLKIINVYFRDNQLHILMEGLNGKEYDFFVITKREILAGEGINIHSKEKMGKRLKLIFEEGKRGYSRKEIVIKFE